MIDLIYVVTIAVLFGLLWALARVCEWARPR
jgi:hypothetical protein